MNVILFCSCMSSLDCLCDHVTNVIVGHISLWEVFSSHSSDTHTPLTHSDWDTWCVPPPCPYPAVTDTHRRSAMGAYRAPVLFHCLLHTLCRNLYRSLDHAALASMGNRPWGNFCRSARSRGISQDCKRKGRGTWIFPLKMYICFISIDAQTFINSYDLGYANRLAWDFGSAAKI